MAYIAKIQTATKTIDFIGSNFYHLEDAGIIIHPVDEKIAWTSSPDGDVPTNIYYEGRKIEIVFSVTELQRRNIMDRLSAIEDILRGATEYYLAGGKFSQKAEFVFAFDGASPSYFEVLYGKIKLPKNLMSVEQVLQSPDENGYYRIKNVTVELLCKPRITEKSIVSGTLDSVPLTNCHGTNVTAGIGVDNSWDSTYCNYISVAAVDGDMPIPTMIKIEHDAAKNGNIGKIFMGHTVRNHNQDIDIITELEASNPNVSYAGGITHSNQADSKYSDGNAELVTLPAIAAPNYTPTTICWTTLPTVEEGIYRAFLISGSTKFPETTMFRITFYQRSLTGDTTGKKISGEIVVPIGYHGRTETSYIVDLGLFILPPTLQGLSDVMGGSEASKWAFTISAGSSSGATQQVSFDRLMMMPIDKGFRVLDLHAPLGETADQDEIIDDGWRGYSYVQSNGANEYYQDNVDAFFSPIMLEPNKVSYVWFLFEDYGFGASTRSAYRTMGADVTLYSVPSYKYGVIFS